MNNNIIINIIVLYKMLIINITIIFYLTIMLLSLLKINEGLTTSNINQDYATKSLLKNNSIKISNIKSKVNSSINPLNSILNKIKYWKKKINETQESSKEQSNEVSNDDNINIKKPLPKPIL